MSEVNKSIGWLEWIGFRGGKPVQKVVPSEPSTSKPVESLNTAPTPPSTSVNEFEMEEDGWERVKAIYKGISMERDVIERVARVSFFGGFLVGGATGYAQARQTYEINNQGRKYLSPSDSVKRKLDYAIIRFAKGGFGVGIKCAIISGSIVLLSTHLAAYRNKFSSWYFPAMSGATACVLHSALVGGVFAFPIGVLGSMKAVGLGISSGLTLSAVVHLYAMSIDKSVNESYRLFKRDYEKDLKASEEWDSRVKALMESENLWWRQQAVQKLKKMDQEKLSVHDD